MSLPQRLRADLVATMQTRNKTEVSIIRTLIAAIENAEAVEAELPAELSMGLNHDVARRKLSEAEIVAVVARERDDVAAAIDRCRELGLTHELTELEERLQVVGRYVVPMP